MVVHAKIHTKLYIASCCGRRQMHRFVLLRLFKYRIVASTNTCYYSENQIFYSLEYRISSYSFLPLIVSSPWIVTSSSEETIQVFIT